MKKPTKRDGVERDGFRRAAVLGQALLEHREIVVSANERAAQHDLLEDLLEVVELLPALGREIHVGNVVLRHLTPHRTL